MLDFFISVHQSRWLRYGKKKKFCSRISRNRRSEVMNIFSPKRHEIPKNKECKLPLYQIYITTYTYITAIKSRKKVQIRLEESRESLKIFAKISRAEKKVSERKEREKKISLPGPRIPLYNSFIIFQRLSSICFFINYTNRVFSNTSIFLGEI